jgi:hypothetical protein
LVWSGLVWLVSLVGFGWVVLGLIFYGIAHFPSVAGGLLDAAIPLIDRGRSAAWAGRSSNQDAAVPDKTHCSKARNLESFQEAGRDFEKLAELSGAKHTSNYRRFKPAPQFLVWSNPVACG